jgi:hypothetical protein
MLLTVLVSAATLVVLCVAGLAGFLIERSANRHDIV